VFALITATSLPLRFHVTALFQLALFTSRHTPAASLRTMRPARGEGGRPGVSGGEKALPAFGGGFGSPGYGFIEAVDTRVSGMTVESLPHSKMAAYTKVPSVTRARGSSPAMLITVGALARLAGL
jgi:hypothetical protein